MKNISISGVIISAGLSGRMKRFKPLADFRGKSFLYNIMEKLENVCDEIIIVTGHESEKLQSEIKNELSCEQIKLKFVYNELFRKGMFTSLQKGILAAMQSDWVLYHFVDQPGVPVEFYTDLIAQIDESHNWIQPAINGRRGHPLLLRNKLFNLIISQPPASNLRELSETLPFAKKIWECDYPEIFQDIDTEEDYSNLG